MSRQRVLLFVALGMQAAVLIAARTGASAFVPATFIKSASIPLVSWVGRAVGRRPLDEGKESTVKMNLWKIFGGGSDGIDYSQLKGMASKEAAEYAQSGEVKDKTKDGHSIATFGGGCFWGVELAYQRIPGVIDTSVGYTQGQVEKPTYEAVCAGITGHTEAVQVFYDPKQVSFDALCKLLLSRVDPTLRDQVGGDRGTQYRHGIYYHNSEQQKVGKEMLEAAQAKYKRPILTELKPAAVFWPAEEYHQKYLEKGGRFGMGQSAAKGCNDPIRCYG